MALPQGINIRQTAGYVTDGANEHGETTNASFNYPTTTAQGNNVGWESGGSGVAVGNGNSGYDPRIAGFCIPNAGPTSIVKYRIDLPATGDYKFRCACGSAGYVAPVYLDLHDTTTSLGTLATTDTGAAGSFTDAANNVYTAANWPGSNALTAAKTFSTTICRFVLGNGVKNYPELAHVYVEAAGGAAATRGTPFGTRGTAFNGGRTLLGIIRRVFTDLRLAHA